MSYPQVPSDLDKLHFHRVDYRKCYVYEDPYIQVLKSYNTIVAMYDKRNQILYRDETVYSRYTAVHIGVFVRRYTKLYFKEVMYIPQDYLINFIRGKLKGKSPEIEKDIQFANGTYVKLYRLHNVKSRFAKIINHSDWYSFVSGDKNLKCTVIPVTYDVCYACYRNEDDTTYLSCNPKNLLPISGGI